MFLRSCLLLLVFFASGSQAGSGDTISVLTYNVQNLPGSGFDDRASRLLEFVAGYDLVVLQEDFRPDGLYSRWASGPLWRGPGPRWRWHNVLAPLARPLGYRAPYDSGLTMLVGEGGPIARVEPLLRLAFDDCHGVVTHSHDCWANKGLLGVRVTLAGGAQVDLYTTHLDAGSGSGDHEARLGQLIQMENALREHSASRAIIFAGDFNMPRKRPEQYADLVAFKRRLGLEDSDIHPNHADWESCQRDFIYLRQGERVHLQVISGGEPPASTPGAGPEGVDFCDGDSWRGRALSDHPALAAVLRVQFEDE